MKRHFITYGDIPKFDFAKKRILSQAVACGEFDSCRAFGRDDVSEDLRASAIMSVSRGGGLWSWKPDIILTEFSKMSDGDILVYCDSGCFLYETEGWRNIWHALETHDIYAYRLCQRVKNWTRRELLEEFSDNGESWADGFQFMATVVILKKSAFTVAFVKEWRRLMICRPVLAMDVLPQERSNQHLEFRENRHDQAVFTALLYRAMREKRDVAFVKWDDTCSSSIFRKKPIVAKRWFSEAPYPLQLELKNYLRGVLKDVFYKPWVKVR